MRNTVAIFLLIAGAAAADTPIKGLTLQSDANAGGHLITNLGPGFAASAGLASSLDVAAASALGSNAQARWSGTNVAIGAGAVASGAAPVAFVATNGLNPASAGGFYFLSGQYNGSDYYTNENGWALWDDTWRSFVSPAIGNTELGWSVLFGDYPFDTYAHIHATTTGTLVVVQAGAMPIAQIGHGTNATPGTLGWMGHPLARWDGAVWIGTQWVQEVHTPLLVGGRRLISVTNNPVVNGIITYGGSDTAAWQIPTSIVAVATNVEFWAISGDPYDNATLSNALIALTNTAAPVPSSSWRDPNWFKVLIAEIATNAPDTSVFLTNLDQVVRRDAFGAVRRDRLCQVSGMRGLYPVAYSVSPTNIASVSSNGYVTHLSDGVATITVSTAYRSVSELVYMITQPGRYIDQCVSGDTGTFRRVATDSINAGLTNGEMTVFSSIDHTNAVYTRNTNLFLRPAPACLAVWSSVNTLAINGGRGGVLLTPQHAVMASHASFVPRWVGVTCRWVRVDNTVTQAVVTAVATLPGDVTLVRLDRPVTGITPARLLAPEDVSILLPTGLADVPLALGDTHFVPRFQCVVGTRSDFAANHGYAINAYIPQDPQWNSFFHHVSVVGDSSQPLFASTGGDLVLMTELLAAMCGPSMPYWSTAIQAQIVAWGDTNVLSFVNSSAFRRF